MEDMRQAELAEQSMMALAPDDGPSLLDQLEMETPQQPDEAALSSYDDKKQAAQMELEANRKEIRDLCATIQELQHKWDAHLLQTQREEAQAEKERQQREEEELVRSRSMLSHRPMVCPCRCPHKRVVRLEQALAELRAQQPRRVIVVYENQRRPIVGEAHPDSSRDGFHSSTLLDVERPNFSDSESRDCIRGCGRVARVEIRLLDTCALHLQVLVRSICGIHRKNPTRCSQTVQDGSGTVTGRLISLVQTLKDGCTPLILYAAHCSDCAARTSDGTAVAMPIQWIRPSYAAGSGCVEPLTATRPRWSELQPREMHCPTCSRDAVERCPKM